MLVKCINNKDNEDSLTINKIYNVLEQSKHFYGIIDDIPEENCYSKNRFKVIEPNELVTKLHKVNNLLQPTKYIVYFDTKELTYHLLENYEFINISTKTIEDMVNKIIEIL